MDLHLTGTLHAEVWSGAARLAASALVAGLWQGLLLCAATGVVVKALPGTTARLRFAVWLAVFCVSVAMPFVVLFSTLSAGQAASVAASHLVIDPRWSYLLAAVWLLAAAYRVVELALQGLGLRSLWRSAAPVPDEPLSRLDLPLTVAGRRVEICTSGEVDRPSVIGFFAPRILIPEWLLAQLTATELNHIVLHEIEHLRRRDDWANLLQKIGLVLLPLNPALFWIDRRLSTERELACDDGVLERTKTPRAYAASLTSVAERRLEARRSSRIGALALAATGLLRRRSELGERIESILGTRTPINPVFAGGMAALLVAGVIGSAAWLARAPQLISFGDVARQTASIGSIPVARESAPRQLPAAGFQNVSFHTPVTPGSVSVKSAVRRPKAISTVSRFPGQHVYAQRANAPALPHQFVVLTSWEDTPASFQLPRVVIATPDGRFFVAPYAAVPTQAGWLFVQL